MIDITSCEPQLYYWKVCLVTFEIIITYISTLEVFMDSLFYVIVLIMKKAIVAKTRKFCTFTHILERHQITKNLIEVALPADIISLFIIRSGYPSPLFKGNGVFLNLKLQI